MAYSVVHEPEGLFKKSARIYSTSSIDQPGKLIALRFTLTVRLHLNGTHRSIRRFAFLGSPKSINLQPHSATARTLASAAGRRLRKG